MSAKVPIVLDGAGQLQQLQAADDLQIPLTERVSELESKFKQLVDWMQLEGFQVPFEIVE